jgi:hypothetical protein
VHHLCELLGVIEPDHHDPKIAWAICMDRLLRDLHHAVTGARAADQDWLDPDELAGYRAAVLGYMVDPEFVDTPLGQPAPYQRFFGPIHPPGRSRLVRWPWVVPHMTRTQTAS